MKVDHLRYLMRRWRFARAPKLRAFHGRDRSSNGVVLPSLALLGAGVCVGVAATLLLTPRSSAELRHDLNASARRLRRMLDQRSAGTQRQTERVGREQDVCSDMLP
jgi:hypothetical protein